MAKSLAAASQGAAGAIVQACIASVTEPLTNRILVNRVPVEEAWAEITWEKCFKFFQTALPLNFVKFPLFEALNVAIRDAKNIPPELRGTYIGFVFTTATLPITNYRFCKSMGKEVTTGALFTAYVPTVIRDIIYANARQKIFDFMQAKYPHMSTTTEGRIFQMFITVVSACVISSPGNELRGYMLQPKDSRKSFAEFFQLNRYVRSTSVGALVMGASLGLATVIGPPVQAFLPRIKNDPKVQFGMFLAFVAWFVHKQNTKAEEDSKGKRS